MTSESNTLPPDWIIKRFKDEIDTASADLRERSSYNGPDPDEKGTQKTANRKEVFCEIMTWLRDAEMDQFKANLNAKYRTR